MAVVAREVGEDVENVAMEAVARAVVAAVKVAADHVLSGASKANWIMTMIRCNHGQVSP